MLVLVHIRAVMAPLDVCNALRAEGWRPRLARPDATNVRPITAVCILCTVLIRKAGAVCTREQATCGLAISVLFTQMSLVCLFVCWDFTSRKHLRSHHVCLLVVALRPSNI